jgi:DNA-binding response OmpR family regulator
MATSPPLTILIVEDEPLIGLDVEEALELAGFGTLLLACPIQASELLKAGASAFAGLVTDIRLGTNLTGWDLGRAARGQQGNFPVVYMSGDSAHDHCIYGVPDSIMVQKPFVSAQIVTAITALLNALPATAAEQFVLPIAPLDANVR